MAASLGPPCEKEWEQVVGLLIEWVAGAFRGDKESLRLLEFFVEELDGAPISPTRRAEDVRAPPYFRESISGRRLDRSTPVPEPIHAFKAESHIVESPVSSPTNPARHTSPRRAAAVMRNYPQPSVWRTSVDWATRCPASSGDFTSDTRSVRSWYDTTAWNENVNNRTEGNGYTAGSALSHGMRMAGSGDTKKMSSRFEEVDDSEPEDPQQRFKMRAFERVVSMDPNDIWPFSSQTRWGWRKP